MRNTLGLRFRGQLRRALSKGPAAERGRTSGATVREDGAAFGG